MNVTTVVSISTLGRVTSYKVLVSSDCIVFDELTGEEGNAKVPVYFITTDRANCDTLFISFTSCLACVSFSVPFSMGRLSDWQ